MLGIPPERRLAADRRVDQLKNGRTDKRKKTYSYRAQMEEGVDYNKVGRYIFYTKKGVKKWVFGQKPQKWPKSGFPYQSLRVLRQAVCSSGRLYFIVGFE